MKDCEHCDGTGQLHFEAMTPITCEFCNGTGIKGKPLYGVILTVLFWVVSIYLTWEYMR